MEEKPPEPRPIPSEFKDALADLVLQAQMIEYMLKAILEDVAAVASLALGGDIPFRRSTKKDKRTLGTLIEAFAPHSPDEGLTCRLRAFAEHRNTAARSAYVWAFVHVEHDPEKVLSTIPKIKEHTKEAEALLHLLTLESIRLSELKRKYQKT